jgi:hypothetical protein
VLGYRPIYGHLRGMANRNNYRYSEDDTDRIIDWLKSNVEINIVRYDGNFSIEAELIKEFCPLLNYQHNPIKLQELKDDRKKCIKIARGELNI